MIKHHLTALVLTFSVFFNNSVKAESKIDINLESEIKSELPDNTTVISVENVGKDPTVITTTNGKFTCPSVSNNTPFEDGEEINLQEIDKDGKEQGLGACEKLPD